MKEVLFKGQVIRKENQELRHKKPGTEPGFYWINRELASLVYRLRCGT